MTRFFRFGVCVILLVSATGRSFSQGGATGAISGTVQDSSGAGLPNAKVEIVSVATGALLRTETTNASGLFTAPLLPTGAYTLRVGATGFSTATVNDIVVRVTETTRLTIPLTVQNISETVEIVAQVTSVETSEATTGESLGTSIIGGLPLATQNFQQLLTLSAGASSNLNGSAELGRGNVRMNVNGGREDNNNYLIEGISASDHTMGELLYTPVPSVDAVGEFKVSTSLYDASQGRNGGGNINATLKSGTSKFHGDLFEYFRNTALNANEYFFKQLGQPRPDIKQNLFGGSVGGPGGRGAKLGYFFLNYQGTRQDSGLSPGAYIQTGIPYIPAADRVSPAALAADPNCFDPAANITAANIDPIAFQYISARSTQFGAPAGGYLYPLTSAPASTPCMSNVNFDVSIPGRYRDDQATATWDRDFRNGKDSVAARFFWTDTYTHEPFGGGFFSEGYGTPVNRTDLNFPLFVPARDRFLSVSETHLFSSSLVNEFRFGFNVIQDQLTSEPVQGGATATSFGIDRPTNNQTNDLYRVVFSGFHFGSLTLHAQTQSEHTPTFADTISFTLGAHTFRAGAEMSSIRVYMNMPDADNGVLNFVPGNNPLFNALPNNASDFQNLLTGNLGFAFGGGGTGNHQYRYRDTDWFVQDDYRIRNDLTLNLGFRMDFVGAPHDDLCHIANEDVSLAPTGQIFLYPTCVNKFKIPGLVGTEPSTVTRNGVSTILAPRIGFAYDLFGHHTTSIRGGYGIYSVREDLGLLINMAISPPFSPFVVAFTGVPCTAGQGGGVATLQNLFACGSNIEPADDNVNVNPNFVPTPSFFEGFSLASAGCDASTGMPLTPTIDTSQTACFSGTGIFNGALLGSRHWIVPTMQQWNLTMQRQLLRGWVLEVGYVGSKGTHLREARDQALAQIVGGPANPFNPNGKPITVAINDTGNPNFGQTFTITDNTQHNLLARSPYLGVNTFGNESFLSDANSNYHSLQATILHHFSKGLYFQSAYTFSKSIDDTSTSNAATDTRYNNQNIARQSRGLSDFNHKQRWVTSYTYDLPFFSHQSGFAGHTVGGWAITGVLTFQSGSPFTVIDNNGGSAAGSSGPGLVTPTWAPGATVASAYTQGSIQSRLNAYINLTAFQPNALVGSDNVSTGFGNVGRNIFVGPLQRNLDFSVSKRFRLTERQSVQFATQFFNFTNTPSFGNPQGNALDIQHQSTFGQINSTVGTPRLIQFSVKYAF
jgi:hypothetical protein